MATIGDGLVRLYYMLLLSSCGAVGYKFRSMSCARDVTHEYFMLHSFSIEFIVSRCYSPSRSASRIAPRWAPGGWASVGTPGGDTRGGYWKCARRGTRKGHLEEMSFVHLSYLNMFHPFTLYTPENYNS